jgi:hypothetical protein
MLFVLFAVHAHDAGGEAALSRVARPPDREKAGLKRVAVGEDVLIQFRPKDEDEPLGILFEDGKVAVPFAKGQHAGHRVVDEVE